MKIYKIYCITNLVNNKKYIGFTGRTLEYRFACHKAQSRKINEKKGSRLYAAMRKYGEHNFIIVGLCSSLDRDYTLNTLEPYFIKFFNTTAEGYNVHLGGQGISYHSTETKKLLKELHQKRKASGWITPWKGRKHTEETKRKMSNSQRGKKKKPLTDKQKLFLSKKFTGPGNPFYGKTHNPGFKAVEYHSDETKNKLSSLWEITFPSGDKQIIRNLKKFCKENNLSAGTLRLVSIGKRTHHKNYKCRQLSKGLNSHLC